MEKGHLTENPALNPDRVWLPTGECAQEAYYLTKSLSTTERAVVTYLLEHQDVAVPIDLIASVTAVNEMEMPKIVRRINRLAEALGYVPVIASTSQSMTISATTATTIAMGLKRADRQ